MIFTPYPAKIVSFAERLWLIQTTRLAYAEMRLILAHLIFEFDMELTEASRGWLHELRPYNL